MEIIPYNLIRLQIKQTAFVKYRPTYDIYFYMIVRPVFIPHKPLAPFINASVYHLSELLTLLKRKLFV